jgi:hypothetical protein
MEDAAKTTVVVVVFALDCGCETGRNEQHCEIDNSRKNSEGR